MTEAEILKLRRQARIEKEVTDSKLMILHRRAADALDEAKHGDRVRQIALRQIEKWDKGGLCNPRYVTTWRVILDLPPRARRAAILRDDPEGLSLRQNSPFGFLIAQDAE